MKRFLIIPLLIIMIALLAAGWPVAAASANSTVGINVLLKTGISDQILAELSAHGQIADVLYEIDALTMRVKSGELAAIRALPYVASASPDAVRNGAPIDTVAAENFLTGMNTWDLDAVNVTDYTGTLTGTRSVAFDGTGVYVAVLDTGLLDSWRQYFPQERIAVEYAKSFCGGGNEMGNVSEQPNKWEHDQNSHGTHVTSTILGYNRSGVQINGVAPMATVIPVKVLNQNGSGWSSMVAAGIIYIADLKAGELSDHPVVINMSLGGPDLDPIEKAAVDYAVAKGVIIVASAGNEGEEGMGYPGAYGPVISVAASGWVREWEPVDVNGVLNNRVWWYMIDVKDPIDPSEFYITDFSSREKEGQDLDVAAPGSWIPGPYQKQSGKVSYYYLGGTSMASPHVAGIAALMAQKCPSLTAGQAETILEGSAVHLAPGSADVLNPYGTTDHYTWGADATGSGLVDAAAALAATP
jgi:subtilisin family serine protease